MLPDSNFLSAPVWLINLLHIVTLSLHLMAMNFVFGGLIVLLFAKIKDKWNNPAVANYVKMLPNIMAATVSFGVAPLLFAQLLYPRQIYSSAIVSAWFWLLITAAAIISYYLFYAATFGKNQNRTKTYLTLAVIGLFYISFVYSSVFSLAEHPVQTAELYAANQSGMVINPAVGTYIFRWLHMVLGAITVGAYFVGVFGKNNDELFQQAKKFFLYGMVSAMVIGFAYMFTLGDLLRPFMRSIGIWMIMLGLIFSLGSLHFFMKKKLCLSGIMLSVSFVGMVIARHTVRLLRLEDYLSLESMKFVPQWSIFIIFLICFVIAIALIWYMLKLFFAKDQTT